MKLDRLLSHGMTKTAACSVLGLLLSALPAAAQDSNRVLRVVPSADVAELDPTRGANLVARIYSHMVFDTLFALDKKLAPQPMMVDKKTISNDGLTYTFTLRSGLKFHDGSNVTTKDVIASLNRWMKGTSIGNVLNQRVAFMAAVDDLTFRMVLKEKFGLVEYMLAGPGAPIAAIMREADANRPDNVALTTPIGSGPFKYNVVERRVGAKVVFERNSAYPSRTEPADGLAGTRVVHFDRVEWTIMPDATTAANALEQAITDLNVGLASLGSQATALDTQQDFLAKLSDEIENGIGNLVDADLAKESAKLQSLQIKQQLGAQALSIANQAPQVILSLFKG